MEDSSGTLHFGKFNLETRDRRLTFDGHEIYLRPKTYNTLLYLVERPGHLVTKNDLLDAVWDGVEVSENALTRCIKEARAALGDDIQNPHFIRTVPRLGYEFVAPVENLAESDSRGAAEEEPTASGPVTDEGTTDVRSSKTPVRRKLTGTPVPQTPSRARIRTNLRKAAIWLVAAVFVAVAVSLRLNLGGLRERVLGEANVPRFESVAVLPLENLSGDKEQEYFADGMTDALITDLGKIGALRVISRTSVMRYKGTTKPLPDIARQLHVDAVLEGAVLRSGNRVRITAQLVRMNPERHVWAEAYERDLRDVLALQADVALAIADHVRAELTPRERTEMASQHPVNPQGYTAYLKGRYERHKDNEQGYKRAVEYFRQAIGIDPGYALAYAALAGTYADMGNNELLSAHDAYPQAEAAALRALEIDGTLAEAHSVLGLVEFRYDWNWLRADAEYRRAIELSPGTASFHYNYGWYLVLMGRWAQAGEEIQRAQALDPLSLHNQASMGDFLYCSHQFDRAVEQLQKTLEISGGESNGYAHSILGKAYMRKRMFAAAIAEQQKAIMIFGESPMFLAILGNMYGVAGKNTEALKILNQLKEQSERKDVSPYDIALVYIGLGDKDQAFSWLEKAYQARSNYMSNLRVDPMFDSMRSDPRFQDLLQRMNFPP